MLTQFLLTTVPFHRIKGKVRGYLDAAKGHVRARSGSSTGAGHTETHHGNAAGEKAKANHVEKADKGPDPPPYTRFAPGHNGGADNDDDKQHSKHNADVAAGSTAKAPEIPLQKIIAKLFQVVASDNEADRSTSAVTTA